MRRREFIAGLMLATTVERAHAQQRAKVYRIAVINPSGPVSNLGEKGMVPSWRAFFQRLRELGYVEGQNLSVDRYSGEGKEKNFAELARQVVQRNPDVICAPTGRLVIEFKAATNTIPIVTNVVDPVAYGIVPSLARPGGNITGATVEAGVEIWGKRLALLHEMVPAASRVAFLAARRVWDAPDGTAAQEAARRIKISLVGPPLETSLDETEYRRVLAAMTQDGVDALAVGDEAINSTNPRLIVELAEKARLPAIYPFGYFASWGGLMAYGIIDFNDLYRHLAEQIDQILKGTKPGEIPFYQPTKFALIINVKTAKMLGLTVPDSLLAQADEVIE